VRTVPQQRVRAVQGPRPKAEHEPGGPRRINSNLPCGRPQNIKAGDRALPFSLRVLGLWPGPSVTGPTVARWYATIIRIPSAGLLMIERSALTTVLCHFSPANFDLMPVRRATNRASAA
jgi:hypothetical protein